jgi:S-adenosylmethionine hydrolase
MSLITLVTDFGTRDYYVGAIKGVIYQIAPKSLVVDVTHDVGRHDVLHAAFVLRQIWPCYPSGTVHLVVVDPGVGSPRRIVVGRYAGQLVVAPDNGLISLVHRDLPLEALHVAENPRYFLPKVSNLFHGRDIMAPLAAWLSTGLPIERVGSPTDRIEVLQLAKPEFLPAHAVAGAVLYVDRFGSLVTNIAREDLVPTLRHRRDVKVHLGQTCVGPIRTCYEDVPVGEPLALIGSADLLEIAVHRGSAAERFQSDMRSRVEVR